jgi:hypothetical protein
MGCSTHHGLRDENLRLLASSPESETAAAPGAAVGSASAPLPCLGGRHRWLESTTSVLGGDDTMWSCSRGRRSHRDRLDSSVSGDQRPRVGGVNTGSGPLTQLVRRLPPDHRAGCDPSHQNRSGHSLICCRGGLLIGSSITVGIPMLVAAIQSHETHRLRANHSAAPIIKPAIRPPTSAAPRNRVHPRPGRQDTHRSES